MKHFKLSPTDEDTDDLSYLDWEDYLDIDDQEAMYKKRKVHASKKRDIKRRLDDHLEAKKLRHLLSPESSWN